MAQSQKIDTIFGANNYGLQAGTIAGSVTTEFHSHAPELPETPPSPLSIALPFDRDPDYIQRGSLLDEITMKLLRPAARVALVGLGGVGKSQLAIEFAHQRRRKAPQTWLLWLHVSDDARFEQSVRSILDQLKVCGRNDPKANIFRLLYGWLCDVSHGPWLVILDNADDARVLLGTPPASEQGSKPAVEIRKTEPRLAYIPKCDHGRVLVTSRTKEAARELVYDQQIIAIEPMDREQAIALLAKKLGRPYIEQNAQRLAKELDYMPLALSQGAAYIRQSDGRCSIQQYIDKLIECDSSEASVLDIDERDLRRDLESTNSIMLTWQISFDRIREMHPLAADMLSLMSFFDRQAIPEALLRGKEYMETTSEVSEDMQTLLNSATGGGMENAQKLVNNQSLTSIVSGSELAPADEARNFEKDLAVLRNYCLIAVTTNSSTFKMHRLVQLATKRWLRANGQLERWRAQFVNNLDQAFPDVDYNTEEFCRFLYPHAKAALHLQVTSREAMLRRASLLCQSGWYAFQSLSYADAEKMLDESLVVRRDLLGDVHLDTLTSMLNLANVYNETGRSDLTEELQMKVLEKRREVLGEKHPDTLTCKTYLATFYSGQERFHEAELLQQEVMEARKLIDGVTHRKTLRSIQALAWTYTCLGRWQEAEELYLEAIPESEYISRSEDPDMLTCKDNLSQIWMEQGRLDEAEELQVKVLETRKKVLGENHPASLRSMSHLAWIYLKQGRWSEMECLQSQLIEKRKRVFGEGHTMTLTSMAILAYMLKALGRRKSALALMNSCACNSSESVDHDAYCRFREQWESEDGSPAEAGKACSTSDSPVAGMEKIKKTLRSAFARRSR